LNKSHIQVNINKLLDYLRSLGKFNARHLWSNTEICCADSKTIWELLDDIWLFYSNKKTDFKREKSKSSIETNNFNSELNSKLMILSYFYLIRKQTAFIIFVIK
jgi:hypothetical protein